MKKTFITAGAGSGKTYRITTDVAKMVRDKMLIPDQVIMTTFTKAAAQELREKAKKELINIGLHREAQQMERALIGTIHSVANTFLSKYWYLLGIMPDAAAMEEEELELYRDHSLLNLLTQEDREFLFKYAKTYNITHDSQERKSGINYEFWKKDLGKVLDFMQWYGIDEEQLRKSLKERTESFIKCLEPKKDSTIQKDAQNCITEIGEALRGVMQTPKAKKQQGSINSFKDRNLSIEELTDLESIAKDRCKGTEATKRLSISLAEATIFTEENAKDQRAYASLIFSLANRWQEKYRQYKDEHHLIDFNDMEEMFLLLLDMPEVQQDIRSNYTHLFVDEFQDSNPIQVRIFQKLSSLLNTCYVGDKKQAIYGFRGADAELTSAVADSIEIKETLKHSYRSVEPLVKFSNAIFTEIFKQMPEEEIQLTMPSENGNTADVKHPLRLWPYDKDEALALQIQQLILREKINPKDIAVLACENSHLDKLAEELKKLKVPVCREASDIKESRAGRLLKALLTLVTTPSNQLARAEVAYLTSPGYHVTEIIEHRLDYLSNNESSYLEDIPILKRLAQLRSFKSNEDQEYATNLLSHQSISALVETLVIELDLYAVVQSWENAQAEEANLQAFIDLARKYEDYSTKIAQPATVSGFIEFFTGKKQNSAANENGVYLYTYHKSKGLEWKVVIMLSLERNASDAANIATKNMLGCHPHRDQQPTAENTNPPMTISLVRNIYGTSGDVKNAIVSRLQQHPLWDSMLEQSKAEAARLLYVGVTRAREILILAPKEGRNGSIDLNWFRSVGFANVIQVLGESEDQDLFNIGMPFHMERTDNEQLLQWEEQSQSRIHSTAKDFSALDNTLFIAPSKMGTTPHNIVTINDTEQRMEVR
ncbi:MAG: UvrD-helicase domain-containing protein, partial [Prevotella sp.]|nr:UvrD-helicase domain-containing protein [Prevotella sp.]